MKEIVELVFANFSNQSTTKTAATDNIIVEKNWFRSGKCHSEALVRDVRDSIGSLSKRGFEVRLTSHNQGKSYGSFHDLPNQLLVVEGSSWAKLPPELLYDVIRKLEESESTWPSRKHVIACAAVCRSWRNMCKELVRNICGKLSFPMSLKQPGPREGTIQCFIKKE